ncbi:hypothetical protein [Microbacterium sp.]|uniref:hypothetical protein n=1 Tax=Microbacterium sp. TaxID=51671 RepID=UPI0039E30B1C
MRVRQFDLADSVVVRNGLLTTVNGGLNLLSRAEFPATLDADLAVVVEFDIPVDASVAVAIKIQLFKVGAPESSVLIAELTGQLNRERDAMTDIVTMSIPQPVAHLTVDAPGGLRVRVVRERREVCGDALRCHGAACVGVDGRPSPEP